MATALLIATSPRTAAWQPACQNHHQNGEAWKGEGGRWVECVSAYVHACVCVFLGGGRRAARRKEKLARENKVNEAWRRLPYPVFGRGSRASSFTFTTSRGKDRKRQPQGGGLVEEQWGCNRILRVYLVWLWLLTKETLDSTDLQSSARVFEQTLTCRVHLHFPPVESDLLGFKKTFGMRCQEGMLYTTLQYQGSELLQSQWLALCIDWLPLGKREIACISLNPLVTHIYL